MRARSRKEAVRMPASVPAARETRAEEIPAWEEVDTGRYMPRRIRGSLRGRELG